MTADAQSGGRPDGQTPGPAGAARPQTPAWRDLGPRAASGVVLVAIALAALWRGDAVFVIFWLAASLGVLWEWQRLIDAPRFAGRFAIGAVTLVFVGDFAANAAADSAVVILVLGALATAAVARARRLWAASGLIYAGAALGPVVILRESIFDGAEAVLWLFAVVWMSDVMAYFGGRAIGGRKLWPRVSPGKTWSGFVVGVVCGAAFGVVALSLAGASISWAAALALGAFVAVAAQAGDLFESFVKRCFGAKNSGRLIPGHGGLMDRLDGFIAAASVAALIGVLRYDAASAALGLLRW